MPSDKKASYIFFGVLDRIQGQSVIVRLGIIDFSTRGALDVAHPAVTEPFLRREMFGILFNCNHKQRLFAFCTKQCFHLIKSAY